MYVNSVLELNLRFPLLIPRFTIVAMVTMNTACEVSLR